MESWVPYSSANGDDHSSKSLESRSMGGWNIPPWAAWGQEDPIGSGEGMVCVKEGYSVMGSNDVSVTTVLIAVWLWANPYFSLGPWVPLCKMRGWSSSDAYRGQEGKVKNELSKGRLGNHGLLLWGTRQRLPCRDPDSLSTNLMALQEKPGIQSFACTLPSIAKDLKSLEMLCGPNSAHRLPTWTFWTLTLLHRTFCDSVAILEQWFSKPSASPGNWLEMQILALPDLLSERSGDGAQQAVF